MTYGAGLKFLKHLGFAVVPITNGVNFSVPSALHDNANESLAYIFLIPLVFDVVVRDRSGRALKKSAVSSMLKISLTE